MKEHSAHIITRFFSGGWDFSTAKEAFAYVSDQHSRETAESIYMTAFQGKVKTGGLTICFYHSTHACDVECGNSLWMVPGMNKE